MAEEKLNLIQKLARIRSISDVVLKEKKGFNYNYADITSILAKITAGMKKYRVSLIPTIQSGSAQVIQNVITKTKVDKTGKHYDNVETEMLVTADMLFTWVNDDDPSDIIEVPWFVTGSQADPSQAFGSGLTYCTRYFLCNYFQIALADTDVDAYRSKQKVAEESEDRAIAAAIIEKLDTKIKEYINNDKTKAEEVKKFVSKYRKDSNYLAIKDSELASTLYKGFEEKFINKQEEM